MNLNRASYSSTGAAPVDLLGAPWVGEVGGDLASHYYRARYYDSKLGRFISEDPIGLEGGLNLFAYTESRPTTAVDPFGLDPVAPGPRNYQECLKEALKQYKACTDDATDEYAKARKRCKSDCEPPPGKPSSWACIGCLSTSFARKKAMDAVCDGRYNWRRARCRETWPDEIAATGRHEPDSQRPRGRGLAFPTMGQRKEWSGIVADEGLYQRSVSHLAAAENRLLGAESGSTISLVENAHERHRMPTILIVDGFRFHFFSREGQEPPHIHIRKGDAGLQPRRTPPYQG